MFFSVFIKIPLTEFDPLTVSFTYGDSFAILDPALFGEEQSGTLLQVVFFYLQRSSSSAMINRTAT